MDNIFSSIIPESHFNDHDFLLAQEQKLDEVKPFELWPDGFIRWGHITLYVNAYFICFA